MISRPAFMLASIKEAAQPEEELVAGQEAVATRGCVSTRIICATSSSIICSTAEVRTEHEPKPVQVHNLKPNFHLAENLLDSSTNSMGVHNSGGGAPLMCNSPSASSSGGGGGGNGGSGTPGGVGGGGPNPGYGAVGAAAASSYKMQRQAANVRERKRIQRSAPTGYTKWSFPF